MDKKFICPAKLSRANWLGSDTWPDAFSITADQVLQVVVLRQFAFLMCVNRILSP